MIIITPLHFHWAWVASVRNTCLFLYIDSKNSDRKMCCRPDRQNDKQHSFKLHLRRKRTDGRTDGQTDWRRESNFVHFRLEMWHLLATILLIFLMTDWPNFVYLLVDPRFLSIPLKILWSIAVHFPIGWTALTDTTDKERETCHFLSDRSFVRSSLRLSMTHISCVSGTFARFRSIAQNWSLCYHNHQHCQ